MQDVSRPYIIYLSLLACLAGGCASSSDTETTACMTTACIAEDVQRDLAKRCLRDLNRKSLSRKHERAIYDEYRYPLTDSSNYASWVMMGGQGPTPYDWCRAYAVVKQRQIANAAFMPHSN